MTGDDEEAFIQLLIETFAAVEVPPGSHKCLTCTTLIEPEAEQCSICVQ